MLALLSIHARKDCGCGTGRLMFSKQIVIVSAIIRSLLLIRKELAHLMRMRTTIRGYFCLHYFWAHILSIIQWHIFHTKLGFPCIIYSKSVNLSQYFSMKKAWRPILFIIFWKNAWSWWFKLHFDKLLKILWILI